MITAHQTLLFLTFILLLLHFYEAKPHCTPSACGIIPNISSPFRLNGDPKHCGSREYELVCENNVTSISLNSHRYYVKAINYGNDGNSTIRLVDASINNDDICSFPLVSAYHYNFTYYHLFVSSSYHGYLYADKSYPINFISCPNPLKNSSLFTDITAHCTSSNSSHPTRYAYVKVGHMNASALPEKCMVDLIAMTSWEFKDLNNVSLSQIHQSLLYGFELAICMQCLPTYTVLEYFRSVLLSVLLFTLLVSVGVVCAVVSPPVSTIFGFAVLSLILFYTYSLFSCMINDVDDPFRIVGVVIQLVIGFIILAPRIIIFPLALWLLIYKFRRRHLSIYNSIECFLRSDNKLAPIRYSYPNIKRMTRGFQDKLGEGGYGSVYKGKIRSGHDVAVKLLGKSGGNGQDFMNEIATIGRIHHVNVVTLVGYCAEGSKRALVFDFMPNGSLEKYLFNQEKMKSLNWDTKFEIAVGIARGIEYLHRGCDIQILHFDIKPHNILLDDKFFPKISDFGLAKFCSTDKNTVSLTAARGTIGYVAPELISRSIGAVSYKADVYSFGMLLMELVGLKRDLRGNNDNSSQYFPYWIYDCFEQGKDIETGRADESADNATAMRKMIIVALWCIQMSPDDRPSMNKVLEMLEVDVERLQVPKYPSQSTQIVDQAGITCSTGSVSLLHHDDAPNLEISVQE